MEWELLAQLEGQEIPFYVTTTCAPGQWCEDPWLRLSNVEPFEVDEYEPWKWPASLAYGQVFEGRVRQRLVTDPAVSVELYRRYQVEGRDEVEVPAGSFDVWNVQLEERQELGSGASSMAQATFQVAEGVGLVRAVRREGDARLELELLEWDGGA